MGREKGNGGLAAMSFSLPTGCHKEADRDGENAWSAFWMGGQPGRRRASRTRTSTRSMVDSCDVEQAPLEIVGEQPDLGRPRGVLHLHEQGSVLQANGPHMGRQRAAHGLVPTAEHATDLGPTGSAA